jgi:hypothetical protein
MFQARKKSPNGKDKIMNEIVLFTHYLKKKGFKESIGLICQKKNPLLYQGVSRSLIKSPVMMESIK